MQQSGTGSQSGAGSQSGTTNSAISRLRAVMAKVNKKKQVSTSVQYESILRVQSERIAVLEQRLRQAAVLSKTSADGATLLEVDQTDVTKPHADQVVQQALQWHTAELDKAFARACMTAKSSLEKAGISSDKHDQIIRDALGERFDTFLAEVNIEQAVNDTQCTRSTASLNASNARSPRTVAESASRADVMRGLGVKLEYRKNQGDGAGAGAGTGAEASAGVVKTSGDSQDSLPASLFGGSQEDVSAIEPLFSNKPYNSKEYDESREASSAPATAPAPAASAQSSAAATPATAPAPAGAVAAQVDLAVIDGGDYANSLRNVKQECDQPLEAASAPATAPDPASSAQSSVSAAPDIQSTAPTAAQSLATAESKLKQDPLAALRARLAEKNKAVSPPARRPARLRLRLRLRQHQLQSLRPRPRLRQHQLQSLRLRLRLRQHQLQSLRPRPRLRLRQHQLQSLRPRPRLRLRQHQLQSLRPRPRLRLRQHQLQSLRPRLRLLQGLGKRKLKKRVLAGKNKVGRRLTQVTVVVSLRGYLRNEEHRGGVLTQHQLMKLQNLLLKHLVNLIM